MTTLAICAPQPTARNDYLHRSDEDIQLARRVTREAADVQFRGSRLCRVPA
jgi:hypothetical protein